jgi:hypothetical protein
MKQINCLFFLLAMIILIESKTPNSFFQLLKEYTTSDIINLIEVCKTKNYKIIDPDDYIKKDDEISLEKQLKEVYKGHNVVPIIVIARSLYLKDKEGKNLDIANYTQIIIDEIYQKKIVKKGVPVVIAMISIEGKIMTMKAEGSVSYTITQQDCYSILNIVNKYFSYGEYSYGTLELGSLINYYLKNTSFFARNKRFFVMIFVLIFSFCFCYILAMIAQKIRDRRNLRLTMSDEEKLLKIRDFLKKTRADKKILCENCIICLEPFDNCTSINHSLIEEAANNNINNENILVNDNINNIDNNSNNNSHNNIRTEEKKNDINIEMQNVGDNSIERKNSTLTDNQISTLPCGHRYHVKCITEWVMRKKNVCPMCREKIDVDIPENNEEDDLQNELLNIQIELHPAFALLVFQTINEELTWGAMALPAINGGLFAGLGGFAFI